MLKFLCASVEENFSTIRLKLGGVLGCFHPMLLAYLKLIPPDLFLRQDTATTPAEVIDPTALEPGELSKLLCTYICIVCMYVCSMYVCMYVCMY